MKRSHSNDPEWFGDKKSDFSSDFVPNIKSVEIFVIFKPYQTCVDKKLDIIAEITPDSEFRKKIYKFF